MSRLCGLINSRVSADTAYPLQTVLTSLLSKFVAQLPASVGNFTEEFTATGKKSVSGTYKIAGTYCEPESGYKDDGAIQLLVHG